MTHEARRVEDVALQRERVLREVVRHASTKRELTAAVDSSRSTIDRAVRDLLDVGLVRQSDGRYEATVAGELALDVVGTFHDRMREVSDAVGILDHLPPDTPFDPVFLDGADVYATTPEMPDGVIQRLFDSVESASHLRGVAPVALAGHLEAYYDAAKAGDARVEMVLDADVLDQLVAVPNAREILLAQLDDERVTISRTDVPFSFGLWITEAEAGVVVYSDTGVCGIIVNDAEDAYAWAEEWFEKLSDGARELTTGGIELGED